MRRIIKGVAAALLLLVLLVGLPLLLIAVWPVGLPHIQPTPAGLWAALLRPDDGTLFLTLIKLVGWVTWAILAVAVCVEIVGALRHFRPRPLPGLALPQGIARGLVAAALALFVNANTVIAQPPATSAHAAPLPAAPASAPHRPTERHADSGHARYDRYTVKKGDTLSEIALEHLGNAHRYPAIFKASTDIRQPRGYRLTDPDVIDIGWTLNIPTDDKPGHKPTKITTSNEHQPGVTRTTMPATPTPSAAPATPAPTQQNTEGEPETSTVPAEAAPGDELAPPSWLLTGLAGAGAVLAGSLWLALRRRRAVQNHHRGPGYVTAAPPAATIPVEKTLRHQGRPVSDLLTAIDENLRRLAATLHDTGTALPALLAVAAHPAHLTLHLTEHANLPEPWQADHNMSVWRLSFADLPDDLDPLEPDGPAPWPHLATVGADDTGAWWLVNLEAAGLTAIDGDPDFAADLARYLAAELATSPWSRDIHVDLDGVFDELSGLDPQRLRYHPDQSGIDDVIAAAVDTIDRLNTLHLDDLPAARARQAGDEIWLNHLLITQEVTGHVNNLATLVNEHAGRTAVAALIIGSAEAITRRLEVSVGRDGRVHIAALGLDLIANGITADEARGCVQLLNAAEQLDNTDVPPDHGPGWHHYVDRAGRLQRGHVEPREATGTDDATATNVPQPDIDVVETAATTSEDLAILAPTVPEPTRQAIHDADPTLDNDLADWFSTACIRPRLSVLGPVRVRLGATGRPTEAAKRKPYYTELVAYLASRPEGATSAELCSAFATTPARIHRDLAVVRKWLGADPATQRRFLPDAIRADQRSDGHGLYQLGDVLYDADLFRRLRLRGQVQGADGLDDYMSALSLVSGAPYSELRPSGGLWLSDDRDDQHLLVAIVDTAHLTVTMALQAADLDNARLAAETAAATAPNEDVPKLDLAQIGAANGHKDRRDRLIAELQRQRDSDGPIELASRSEILAAREYHPHRQTG